jgi:UDP-glucose:(heptosyl)LPS alpha-1,3-glucosyltransferase
MKIALVLEKIDLSAGGAEKSVYELACHLSKNGLDVTVVAGGKKPQELNDAPFDYKKLSIKKNLFNTRWGNFQAAVSDHIKSHHYDIVQSVVPLEVADIYQPRGGSVLYGSQRHSDSFGNGTMAQFKRMTAWLNLSRAQQIKSERRLCLVKDGPIVAALSEYVARQFTDTYQLPTERIHVVRNGINIDKLRSQESLRQGQKLRQLYDRDDRLALFVFAAENLRLKGLGWLINAAELAASRLKGTSTNTIVSSDIADFDPMLPHRAGSSGIFRGCLKTCSKNLRDFRIMVFSNARYSDYWHKAQRLGLAEKILFMGPTQQMAAVLHMCDAVVLPSYNDACSRVVMESLAAGKPAITTRYNGAAEFLGDNKYGVILNQCDDTAELAGAMLSLCDKNRQQQLCHNIEADEVYKNVSIERHVRELIELYKNCQGRKRS